MFAGEPGQIKESLVDRLIREGKEAEAAAKARAAAIPIAEAEAAKRLAAATPGPMSKLASVAKGPVVGGALGGAGAGMSFYEAYQRYMNGDTSGAVLSALAGAGGLMSMVPGLQVPGLAVGLGATGAQYALDKYNEPAAPTPNPMASPPPRHTSRPCWLKPPRRVDPPATRKRACRPGAVVMVASVTSASHGSTAPHCRFRLTSRC